MTLTVTVNYFTDGLSGHMNLTLSGSHNGATYSDLTVGANISPTASMFEALTDSLDGVIRDESSELSRPHLTATFSIDDTHVDEFLDTYASFNRVAESGYAPIDYDLFAFDGDGLNCVEYSYLTLQSLGVTNQLGAFPISSLIDSPAGYQYLEGVLSGAFHSYGLNEARVMLPMIDFLVAYEVIHGPGSVNGALLARIIEESGDTLRDPSVFASVTYDHLAEQFIPEQCFLAGTPILLADGTEKPIEEIAPGDWVVSYDAAGNLVPGRVSRTFQKDAKHILDFFGLMVTPGHVMLCGAGRYAGRHVTLLDILRSDGAVVQADGGLIRAATGVPVGSELDAEIEVVTGTAGPKGFVVRAAGRLRMGTRVILENGADLSLAELIAANGGRRTEAGLIASAAGEGPFVWPFGPNLPQPEDYVLARSAVTLAEIYAAAEWETAPTLPGPARGDLGPVGAAPAARRDKMPANLPLSMRAPNRTGLQ